MRQATKRLALVVLMLAATRAPAEAQPLPTTTRIRPLSFGEAALLTDAELVQRVVQQLAEQPTPNKGLSRQDLQAMAARVVAVNRPSAYASPPMFTPTSFSYLRLTLRPNAVPGFTNVCAAKRVNIRFDWTSPDRWPDLKRNQQEGMQRRIERPGEVPPTSDSLEPATVARELDEVNELKVLGPVQNILGIDAATQRRCAELGSNVGFFPGEMEEVALAALLTERLRSSTEASRSAFAFECGISSCEDTLRGLTPARIRGTDSCRFWIPSRPRKPADQCVTVYYDDNLVARFATNAAMSGRGKAQAWSGKMIQVSLDQVSPPPM